MKVLEYVVQDLFTLEKRKKDRVWSQTTKFYVELCWAGGKKVYTNGPGHNDDQDDCDAHTW